MLATAPCTECPVRCALARVSTVIIWLHLGDDLIYLQTTKMLGNTLVNMPSVNINVDFVGVYL